MEKEDLEKQFQLFDFIEEEVKRRIELKKQEEIERLSKEKYKEENIIFDALCLKHNEICSIIEHDNFQVTKKSFQFFESGLISSFLNKHKDCDIRLIYSHNNYKRISEDTLQSSEIEKYLNDRWKIFLTIIKSQEEIIDGVDKLKSNKAINELLEKYDMLDSLDEIIEEFNKKLKSED